MSAVIYAAIVVIWLIVLVPMWLRRHEAALDERSSERFDGAMRVLARRQAPRGVDRRYVVMPRRSAATPVHVARAESDSVSWWQRRAHKVRETKPAKQNTPSRSARPARSPAPPRRVSAAARRRRTLLVLAGLSVLCALLGFTGALAAPVQLVPELLLVLFVVHLRRQAKLLAVRRHRPATSGADRRQAASAPVAATAATAAGPPAAWVAADSPVPVEEGEIPASVEEPQADTETMVVPETAAQASPAVEATASSQTWEPRPVPPPTYSLKPPAPSGDDRWLAVDDTDGDLADDGDGTELDVILDSAYGVGYDTDVERRRAVND